VINFPRKNNSARVKVFLHRSFKVPIIATTGEANFPEYQKSGNRGSQSSQSVALGEELHSGKMAFPECQKGHDTRGRPALGEDNLPREQHSGDPISINAKKCNE
jgi:hypothetical protein